MSNLDAVTRAVARNVRAGRTTRGWSLDQFATRSGVSKGMLVQIEQARTNPSIGTLSKIAEALDVELAQLLDDVDPPLVRLTPPEQVATLWSSDAGSSADLLMTGSDQGLVELWRFRIVAGDSYVGEAHAPGSREILSVVTGELVLVVDGQRHEVAAGASASYDCQRPHSYHNESDVDAEAVLVLIDPSAATGNTLLAQ